MKKMIKQARELNKSTVEVGYLKKDEMAMIAGVQEFGARIRVTDKMRNYLAATGLPLKASTTHITIPERSFIRTGATESKEEVLRIANQQIVDVLTGSIKTHKFVEKLGETVKESIQKTAEELRNPSLHPYTVEMKGSSKPLIDTGKLLEAIEVKVK